MKQETIYYTWLSSYMLNWYSWIKISISYKPQWLERINVPILAEEWGKGLVTQASGNFYSKNVFKTPHAKFLYTFYSLKYLVVHMWTLSHKTVSSVNFAPTLPQSYIAALLAISLSLRTIVLDLFTRFSAESYHFYIFVWIFITFTFILCFESVQHLCIFYSP